MACKLRRGVLAGAILGLLGTTGAQASGFNIPEISIGGLGTANAVVANPRMLGAVPYNPSLAAFHSGTTLSGGLMVVHAESEVTTAPPNTPTTASFQGRDNVFIPNLSLTHQISDGITLAFNTSVPLGLSTQYPVGTFPPWHQLTHQESGRGRRHLSQHGVQGWLLHRRRCRYRLLLGTQDRFRYRLVAEQGRR
ncbi:outer membrane protein transport protein [endosymbiont of unidentified scaly snail isolate Monju]|uniref:outer membrane protein transport protein n=1 Tax=endosymbiont of unidentified scaly snail isolate Monju TaxID=1248727 RepID=UPI001494DFDB|nr:outer membrane protein transport protein [endosymbiont of unidentified scaly snail isolate Monju]